MLSSSPNVRSGTGTVYESVQQSSEATVLSELAIPNKLPETRLQMATSFSFEVNESPRMSDSSICDFPLGVEFHFDSRHVAVQNID